MSNFKIAVILFCITVVVNAEEITMQKDRELSVRKSLDAYSKIEQKEVSTVDKFKKMFTDGKTSGQVRTIFAWYNKKYQDNTYATAIGGTLKYELASFNGFNAGVAFVTSYDIGFLSGENTKHNEELSSAKEHYKELSEAYLNYKNGGFNLRVGRQMFDTPLADSDDIRMIPNTFEAVMLTYEYENFNFTFANVQRWQGSGSGLGYSKNGARRENNWVDIDGAGNSLIGLNYRDSIEFNAWYYDINKKEYATKASYFDVGSHSGEGKVYLHASLQYLHESEIDGSGVSAHIYGALVEVVVHGIGFNLAYNKSQKKEGKKSFSGIGGGSMYTSMDTMIIDEITEDREAEAIVGGVVYGVDNWNFLYAYGDFIGKANSVGKTAHIVEQNIGFEYIVNDEFEFAGVFVRQEDKNNIISNENDWDRFQIMAKYDF